MLINPTHQNFLLRIARETIITMAAGETWQPDWSADDILNQELGVFVSLHKDDELRGCIGYVTGIMPLQNAVHEMARAAAFEDPRFPPVTQEEVDRLDIEISVLTPLTNVDSISEIEIGVHGLVIEKSFYKGLLLPQVAVEYQWDQKAFLEHTCIKAGLAKDAWKEKETIIKKFSAEIFSE
jgi:AmmeMemoRadiSam system protein A